MEAIITGLISLVGTVIGTCFGIWKSSRLTAYRIEELEKKVDRHNNIVERTYILEGEMKEVQHDIRDIKGVLK